jgi:hypothetical protein
MKKLTILLLSIIFLSGIEACKEQDKKNHKMKKMNMIQSGIQTKVVIEQNIQFAFDLTTIKAHKKMMKSMNLQMKHSPDATHFLSLTLLNKDSKKLVKNAEININLKRDKGEVVKHKLSVMSGGGMYHYGTDLKLTKGKIRIAADVKVNGKKYNVKTKFKL